METLQVDARIITATNKDLQKEVDEGQFRADLFYRLNVVTLTLPPLRDRVQDIPLLTKHFLEKFARELRLPVPTITPAVLDRLKRYNWPGNIRELENAIERAMVLTPGDEITEDLLPPQIFQKTDGEINIGLTLDEAVRRFKQNFISRTLQAAGNNQTQAAKTLDIQRTYLNRLLKDLEIHPDSNP
jgi:DNA-binding NtrC family response regulator